MAAFWTTGFKELSISGDGLVVSFSFTRAEGDDIEIAMPAAALALVLPYFAEADREAAARRAGPVVSADGDGSA